MSEPAHRVFALCATCRRDIARWEYGEGWWHLDGNIVLEHEARPWWHLDGNVVLEHEPEG